MPNINPLVNGDVPYPQYSRTTSEYIKESLAIVKGYIYTKDSSGRMIVPISTSGVADLTLGAFQARDNAPAPTAEDTDTVQVLRSGSRIIMKAPSGLVPGQEVELKSSSSTTTQDTVMAAVAPHTKGFLGRIFEIYTKNSDGSKKEVTASNDLVVIDLGVNA